MYRKQRVDMEQFRVYAKLPVFKRRVERSLQVVKEFLEITENPYIAWSTGKDSTACIGLVREFRNVVAVNMDNGVELPDNAEVLRQIDNVYVYHADRLFLDLMDEYGFESPKLKKGNFVRRFEQEHNFDGVIMGLRRDENAVRKRYLRGHIYQRKDGMWTCLPILHWSMYDVFAYLLVKELPIHPMYTRDSLQPLEHRRVGGYISGRNRGSEYGRFVWLREQYPETWQELSARYPEVKQYV